MGQFKRSFHSLNCNTIMCFVATYPQDVVIHTPTMAEPSLTLLFPWTTRARAALEGVWEADFAAGIGDGGVGGVADILVVA